MRWPWRALDGAIHAERAWWRATRRIIAEEQAKTPGAGETSAAKLPPSRPVPAPAPGPWRDQPCGCATRSNPDTTLTCPACAARREDIQRDLLLWADQMRDWLLPQPCPDCNAAPGQPCHATCPRLAGDPDGR